MDTTQTIGIQEIFRIMHDAVAHGAWWPLAGVTLIFVVSAARKLAAMKMGKIGAWLATDHGAMLLTVAAAVASGLGVSLLGGAAPTRATVVGALMAGGTALVAFPTVQKFFLSCFGVNLGLADVVKAASVLVADSGRQTAAPATSGSRTPPAPPPSPPPVRSGEGGSVNVYLVLGAAFLGMALSVLLAGCSLSWPDIARVSATSLNRAIIVGGPLAEKAVASCAADVISLGQVEKFSEAHQKQWECSALQDKLGKGLLGAKAVVTAANVSIDEYEKLKKKDYAAILAPVLKAASDLAALFEAAKIQGLPKIEGVN